MSHSSKQFSDKPNLQYPFEKGFAPETGVPFQVKEGVYWLRMPLPISLDHINLWLLEDGDGWAIVDTGFDADVCKQVWNQVFDSFVSTDQINKIVVTHFHPDHIGLAAWLARKCDCQVHLTQGEYSYYQQITERSFEESQQIASEFIAQLGFKGELKNKLQNYLCNQPKPAESVLQKSQCHFIDENDLIQINGNDWKIIIGSGHSPQHACLYCPDLEVLIAGDQVLPRISSNISVYPLNRDQDPLHDWLESCHKLSKIIPQNTLILPSHQEPFFGHEGRLEQLIHDHHVQLNLLREGLTEPMSIQQAHKLLFKRELSSIETLMASGETLAHINYLWHRAELEKTETNDHVFRYQHLREN